MASIISRYSLYSLTSIFSLNRFIGEFGCILSLYVTTWDFHQRDYKLFCVGAKSAALQDNKLSLLVVYQNFASSITICMMPLFIHHFQAPSHVVLHDYKLARSATQDPDFSRALQVVHSVFDHAYEGTREAFDIYDEQLTMLSMQWGVVHWCVCDKQVSSNVYTKCQRTIWIQVVSF